MKQKLLVFALLCFATSVFSQQKFHYPDNLKQSKLKPQASLEISSSIPGPVVLEMVNPYPDIDLKSESLETQIGETFYDLQTNSSIQNRLNLLPSGEWAASWTGSQEDATHTDRGTAYTNTSGGAWGDAPLQRLESLRCGWPSLTSDASGNEVALSHATATTPYSLNIMRKESGSDTWTETNYPGTQSLGMLWARTAASGDYLHMIALSTPAAFGGGNLDGINGTLLYYRSADGGQTFEVEEVQLPGLDSTFYRDIGPDTYSIVADGATVAIAHYSAIADMAIWKSTDNGDNWTKTIVFDCPLDGYVTDSGYTFEEIQDLYVDGVSPDSMAIPSTDGSGAIVLDLTGKVHLTAGFTYYIDVDLTNGGLNFYPGFGNLWYWNEDMGEDGAVFLNDLTDEALDINGNDSLDIAGTVPSYGNGLTSYPTMAVNDNNDIVLAFACIQEDLVDNATTGLNFRHVLVTRSTDDGATWESPIDVSDSPYGISELGPVTEVMYPTLYPREVDGEMHMLYMRDFTPGLAVIGDMHANLGSSIHYVGVPSDLMTSTQPEPNVKAFDIYPNPTVSSFSVGFDLDENADVSINLLNLLGQRVTELFDGELTSGRFEQSFNTRVGQGVYLLEISADDQVFTKKLMITRE